jgi:hypothetical protein
MEELAFSLFGGMGFELRASHLKAGTLLLEPYLPIYFALIILEMELHELFHQAGLDT